jgi:hypothetical protein
MAASTTFKVGDIVSVPWGLEDPVRAKVVEVWGDPPIHVRVQLLTVADEQEPPVILLLSASVLTAA